MPRWSALLLAAVGVVMMVVVVVGAAQERPSVVATSDALAPPPRPRDPHGLTPPQDSVGAHRIEPPTTSPDAATTDHDDGTDLPRRAFEPTTTTAVPIPTFSPVDAPPPDLAALRAELARLETEQTALATRLREATTELELLDLQIDNEQRYYAERRAATVVRAALPSPRGAAPRALECRGWKKTARCSAQGARRPAQDRSCLAELRGGAAGYCEVRDAASGDHFKVMRADCLTVRTSATFWCELAPQFANVPAEIERAVVAEWTNPTPPSPPSTGIAVVVLALQLQQLERLVRALRGHGCTLPLEVWYFPGNMAAHGGAAWPPRDDPAMTLRPLTTLPFMVSSIKYAKIHAVVHSAFTTVLCLDVGTVPLRDPTYLFSLPQFQDAGTLFWPDVLHPSSPQSRVVATSLLWELMDMPFVKMFEQDDRQWLVNRNAPNVQTALRVLTLLAAQRPNLFLKLELVERTKDFARLAWLKTRTPFHMVTAPPALGGSLVADDGRFCGTHIVQHDPNGELLFLQPQELIHHDDEYLLRERTVDVPDTAQLTHVQTFGSEQRLGDINAEDTMLYYDVRSFQVGGGGNKLTCYAHHRLDRVTMAEWKSFPEAVAVAADKSVSR